MLFNHEYDKRLRVGVIGAGEHTFRTILPCFRYAPIDLVALSDENSDLGLAVARQFGAKHFYPNHEAMLAKEPMDAVFIVAPLDAQGRSPYPALAAQALIAGFHTWIESPPCVGADEIKEFTYAATRKLKWVVTCFKKMFAPAYLKVAEIIQSPAFGGVSSFSMRYPATLPPAEKRRNPLAMVPFLDFIDAYSLLVRLFGECEGVSYLRNDKTGDAVVNINYRSGVVGTLHLTGAQSERGPLERLEVVGDGAHVVVENGMRLIYYRPEAEDTPLELRPTSFYGPEADAPILWEPEFSLGELYNQQLFFQGYVGCINTFAEKVMAGQPPRHGNVVDMLHIMTIYDKIRFGKEKDWLSLY